MAVHVLNALGGHCNISTTMVNLHANTTVPQAAVELIELIGLMARQR